MVFRAAMFVVCETVCEWSSKLIVMKNRQIYVCVGGWGVLPRVQGFTNLSLTDDDTVNRITLLTSFCQSWVTWTHCCLYVM